MHAPFVSAFFGLLAVVSPLVFLRRNNSADEYGDTSGKMDVSEYTTIIKAFFRNTAFELSIGFLYLSFFGFSQAVAFPFSVFMLGFSALLGLGFIARFKSAFSSLLVDKLLGANLFAIVGVYSVAFIARIV